MTRKPSTRGTNDDDIIGDNYDGADDEHHEDLNDIGDKGGVCLRATGAKKRLKSGKQT